MSVLKFCYKESEIINDIYNSYITDGQMKIIPKAGRWKSSCAHAKAAAIAPGLQNAEK